VRAIGKGTIRDARHEKRYLEASASSEGEAGKKPVDILARMVAPRIEEERFASWGALCVAYSGPVNALMDDVDATAPP